MAATTVESLPAQCKVYPNAQITADEFSLLIRGSSSLQSSIAVLSGGTLGIVNNTTFSVSDTYVVVDGRLIHVPAGTGTFKDYSSLSDPTTIFVGVVLDINNSNRPAYVAYGTSSDLSSLTYCTLGYFKANSSGIKTSEGAHTNGPVRRRIYEGTSAPVDTTGSNGDIYIMYSS